MNLYIKIHTSCIAFLADNKQYFVLPLSKDLALNGRNIKEPLENNNLKSISEIVIEKPFLKFLGGNNQELAETIVHIQRNFGVLLYILSEFYPDVVITHISSKIARDGEYPGVF